MLQRLLLLFFFLNYTQTYDEVYRYRRDIYQDIWGDDTTTTTQKAPVTVTSRNPDIETTTSSDSCTCVPYYLCENGTINSGGEGVIDIRVNECGSYLEKCCGQESVNPEPSPTPPPEPKGCGYRNPNGVGFKIKQQIDKEAEFGEFPWMTAIFHKKDSRQLYLCGGALIHPQVVVTAAHCVKDKDKLRTRLGEWDTQTEKEQYPYQDLDVSTVVIHPQFKPGVLYNDIALLFLAAAVEPAPHINVICLPPPNTVVDSGRCFSSGWGRERFEQKGVKQVILKKIDVPMVARKQCQDNLRKTRLGKWFQLHESFVCAGGEEGKDACTGDGGSPLVCPIEGEENRYFHVGIVAWGIGCGQKMVPGVYVNVPKFRAWIDKEVQKRNFEISTYAVNN